MRKILFLLTFMSLAGALQAQRQRLGIFSSWGAFQENERCYAIAEANRESVARGSRPFASIGFWPGRSAGAQFHVRLSADKREGSAVLLRIDERTFQLRGGRRDAWAPNARADAAIMATMRTGMEMSVQTRSERGALVRDVYRLRGAATAIDAAAIACARNR